MEHVIADGRYWLLMMLVGVAAVGPRLIVMYGGQKGRVGFLGFLTFNLPQDGPAVVQAVTGDVHWRKVGNGGARRPRPLDLPLAGPRVLPLVRCVGFFFYNLLAANLIHPQRLCRTLLLPNDRNRAAFVQIGEGFASE